MSFFDFLKKFSNKKEDFSVQPKELTLNEAESKIDSFFLEKLASLNDRLIEISEEFSKEKANLDNALSNLALAKLKNPDLPEKARQLMEGNRKTYIQRANDLGSKLNFPKSFEEIAKFTEKMDKEFDSFDKSIARNHLIMEEFFGKKASTITQIMKALDKQIKEAGKIARDEELKRVSSLKEAILQLRNQIERKEDFQNKIGFLEKAASEQQSEITRKENDLGEIKKGEAFKNFEKSQNDRELTEKELKETESKLLHTFSEIESALKKYHNASQNRLAESYLNNPLLAIKSDNNLEIVNLLNSVEKAVQNEEIILKDKKKDKIIKELSSLNESRFRDFVEKTRGLNEKIKSLSSEILESEIAKKVLKLEDELSKKRIELREKKLEVHEKKNALERIDLQDSREKLSDEVSSVLDTKIKII